MNLQKIGKLVISLFIPLFVGFFGSLFTTPSIANWYLALNKPSFNPPNWVFGPAWTTLFILMGIALFIIWTKGRENKQFRTALILFAFQLVFNFLWSLIFFTFHNPGIALIDIAVLWILIALNIYYFYKINKTAAWLPVPYILWVSFASVLNYMIFILN